MNQPSITLILETENLILRHFVLDDAPFIIELLNTEGWLKFIGDRGVSNIDQAQSYLLNGPIKSYEMYGHGLSAVLLKHTGVPIGMCGILKRPDLILPDIGYAFLPTHTGKGYAYEITKATLEHHYQTTKANSICAIVRPNNISSIKLLLKLGFEFDTIYNLDQSPDLDKYLYKVDLSVNTKSV